MAAGEELMRGLAAYGDFLPRRLRRRKGSHEYWGTLSKFRDACLAARHPRQKDLARHRGSRAVIPRSGLRDEGSLFGFGL